MTNAAQPGDGRRRFLKASAGLAGAWAATGLAGCAALGGARDGGDAVLDQLRGANADPRRRILVRGATILTLDPKTPDLVTGDLLIEGKRIAAIGRDLSAAAAGGSAIVVDARNTIAMPGFVDAHRHAWEGQLRGLLPKSAIGDYMAQTHRGFAPFYQPDDMYVGNLISAVGALDAGITCMIDNSHNSRSPEHSNQAIKALVDSGIRAVHASGAPTFGDWAKSWPDDLERMKRDFFASDDQLVTLRMYQLGLPRANLDIARRLDLWITSEAIAAAQWPLLAEWRKAGLFDHRHTFNHMYGAIPESAWAAIREAGASINVCPRSDSQYMLGNGVGGLQATLDHGIRPGLSVDNETSYGTDMFTEMRVGYHMQRALITQRRFAGENGVPEPITPRDILEFATARGAWCAGLLHKTGTLTVGKEADLILIRADAINTLPLTNAVATVVQFASNQNVDAVFVAGMARKWRGALRPGLSNIDLASLARRVETSRDGLYARRGVKLDVLE